MCSNLHNATVAYIKLSNMNTDLLNDLNRIKLNLIRIKIELGYMSSLKIHNLMFVNN